MAFVCIACSRPRRAHRFAPDHEYDGVRVPKGCRCSSLGDWGNRDDIPPVCHSFYPMTDDPKLCGRCEHENPCHRGARGV